MKHGHIIGLIVGALLSLVVQYLHLKTHGPYEASLERLVWGLSHHDYSRWAIFPALLILPGVSTFHDIQIAAQKRAGLWGFRLFFAGLVLAVIGQIWDYVLFDPWEHPMHGVGFMAQLLAILLMTIGLPTWAFASLRNLTGWQRLIPVLWLLYISGLWFSILSNEESWLYPRYGIDGGFLADTAMSAAYLLMAFVLVKQVER